MRKSLEVALRDLGWYSVIMTGLFTIGYIQDYCVHKYNPTKKSITEEESRPSYLNSERAPLNKGE